jgi:anaerobic magnesium-protoporphyrin IX monomethyl ester cyclase
VKILLIDPPFQKFMDFKKYYIPLGLLYLAGELEKRGHEVSVYDADYHPKGESLEFSEKLGHYQLYIEGLTNCKHPIWQESREVFENIKPDVVGISLISTKFISGMKIAEIYKKMGAKKIICGGVHVSLHPEEVLNNSNVDSIVLGEGEYVFEDALTNRKVVANRIKNLDDISFPARDRLYNLTNYSPSDLGMVISSRGCPFNCSFCCSEKLWKRKVIFRSVDNLIEEITLLKNKYGTTDFYFIDDSFTCNKNRTLEFCQKVRDLKITWSCLTRADLIDEDIVVEMKKSGCRMVKIGLESGSQKVLKIMNKNIKKDDVIRASDILLRNNLAWTAYFMVGTPGENEKDVEETLNFIRKVKPSFISFAVFTPYPGTLLYDKLGLKNISYHFFNHHSNFNKFSDVSLDKIKEVAHFSDNYNKEVVCS